MHKDISWIPSIKVGDWVCISPIWNNTESKERRIKVPTQVLEIRTGRYCETGIMFVVKSRTGAELYLDAGWFQKPNEKCKNRIPT